MHKRISKWGKIQVPSDRTAESPYNTSKTRLHRQEQNLKLSICLLNCRSLSGKPSYGILGCSWPILSVDSPTYGGSKVLCSFNFYLSLGTLFGSHWRPVQGAYDWWLGHSAYRTATIYSRTLTGVNGIRIMVWHRFRWWMWPHASPTARGLTHKLFWRTLQIKLQ